ncbi:protein-L-isoaspartate O-methyltransferase family protein [Roseiterribacter gracilis]|uniref:Protein-L-isoaspartate O-methyltransferase n=1 Tax=Roseiterribacter gracilis TaxID=2812848 RepID=A0A8S8XAI6_9PROT|nr:protein-L-isoaspartate O-methyltransferase [Rhodospirillales bacterium TMPK1]
MQVSDARLATARTNMVDGQIRPNKVTDIAILAAFLDVPRESFAPTRFRDVAYVDETLSFGGGRYLTEPAVLARLLQAALPRPTERALIIGGGSGYSAAILARLVSSVIVVEQDAALLAQARMQLAHVTNVTLRQGALVDGAADAAPFDVILIDGAVEQIPAALDAQLAESGRLVTVRRENGTLGRAILRERDGGALSTRVLFDAGTPVLPGFERGQEFSL